MSLIPAGRYCFKNGRCHYFKYEFTVNGLKARCRLFGIGLRGRHRAVIVKIDKCIARPVWS